MPEFKFLEEIKFASDGLIPTIVQDVKTKDVLMMAYMNKEALRRTLETCETWFYSRSRQTLWHKGESSGHTQKVQEICFDCDQDTLLIKVEPAGPACHKGYSSCFFRAIDAAGKTRNILQKVFAPEQVYGEKASAHEEKLREGDTYPAAVALDQAGKQAEIARLTILKEVYQVIKSRQATLPEGSYTAYLFKQGRDKICKKIGEEAAEVIIAAKNQVAGELIYESADLLYHLMVLWAEAQVTPEEVMQELAKRR